VPTIVGVRIRGASRPVPFDAAGTEDVAADEIVVVATERGRELGRTVESPREQAEGERVESANRVDRVATPEDLKRAEELTAKEREALPVYRRLVGKHKLDMKPTEVEFAFDGGRATFYFVAEERVDFRDLVRDLSSELHVKVDMRQIGVRDEARSIGGLGHCGEQLCCVRFGGDFQPVSIRMAKEQDLPLNPLKISGLCGRLMCCLRYEYEAYKDFKGRAPKKGAIIEVGEQKGKVVDFNTPKETVTMRLEEGGSMTVGLDDMECGSGQGCPCKVRAEALERRASALTSAIGSLASISGPVRRAAPRRRASSSPQATAVAAGAAAPAAEGAAGSRPLRRPRRAVRRSRRRRAASPRPLRRRRRAGRVPQGVDGAGAGPAGRKARRSSAPTRRGPARDARGPRGRASCVACSSRYTAVLRADVAQLARAPHS
jgi:cell fate regulator YaaT (PSP1 superfamily)